MNENTAIRTKNIATGFINAHRKPPTVGWYRVLKSVRVSVQMKPADWMRSLRASVIACAV